MYPTEKYINTLTDFRIKEDAEIAKFTETERKQYEARLKQYRDLKNIIDTSYQNGVLEGKVQRYKAIVANARRIGLSTQVIIQLTGLSEEEIIHIAHQSNNE